MAFDTLATRDFDSVERDIAGKTETDGTTKFFQSVWVLHGPHGSVPVPASAATPFPVTGTTKWTALGTTTTVIRGDATGPTLKNLANSANKLGAEFDNSDSAARFQYADVELLCRGASGMTTGATILMWVIPCLDGTNYEDGGDSITPARPPDEQFYVRAISTAQRLLVRNVLLPPTKFKLLVRNESGVALTNTDDENVLRMRTFGEVLL